jgi:predicted DNA-binding transcriptional regulator AlpA
MSTRRDELLTVPQLLDELGGVSRRTFFRWRELGNAPRCVKLPNGELRVWRSDLLAWLRAHTEHVA